MAKFSEKDTEEFYDKYDNFVSCYNQQLPGDCDMIHNFYRKFWDASAVEDCIGKFGLLILIRWNRP